ncbi:similar to Saccharomyces cerevisiae YMR263W SAP30 Subunit of a histone deacetylase complex [Maudiozyma saulgeensis]|uniref:Similar to Saccharomyces cerevisiae YMR263W SAP30 Subunit of a histone deacetylase complex n=1 Tax=Maudiozyma saulgeensis TaxID=1789683 RepID=A0A1X7RA09_9SACH|nr:similar to Saccharomyces cerevisiae YMR263W SAP30 Subunit of a histone deacetylase complex [Kazachstania saulgeensis]
MARNTNSNSESDSKSGRSGKTNSGTSKTNASGSGSTTGNNQSKQRLTTAQQQYLKNLVTTHITDNHPSIVNPRTNPSDFENYSDDFLRNYKDHFNLNTPDNMTFRGYLLGSKLGSKTYSFERNKIGKPDARIHKKELSNEVKKHFESVTIKEMECIPQFIYKVKSQKKKFRMEFKSGNHQ